MGKNLKLYALIIASMTVPLSFFYAYAEKGPLSIDTEASCITASCHAGMGKKRYVHVAGVDAKQCKRCHEIIKQGEHSFKKVPSETFPLCVKCHSEEFAPPEDIKGSPPKVILKDKELKLHKPFAEGKCTECHDAHESDFYKHLKAEYPQGLYASFSAGQYSLCLKCHKEILKAFTGARTLTDTGFRNGNLNLHFRHVNMLKGRTCQACHHHHGSKKPKLIRDTFIFGKKALTVNFEKTDTGGSCGPACHINIKYDRYEPVKHLMKTTPVPGNDATEEELRLSKEKDMQRQKEKEGIKEGK